MNCDGIIRSFWYLCIDSDPHFTEGVEDAQTLAKWVPHAFGEVQKWTLYETYRINLERFEHEGNDMLNRIISICETWARAYEPELNRQSREWHRRGSPRRHVLRQNPSPTKVMIILAYDSQGILECYLVREGRTVSAAYYRSFLQYNLRLTLRRKCPALLNNAIILHDNATSHIAACVQNLCSGRGERSCNTLHTPLISVHATLISFRN